MRVGPDGESGSGLDQTVKRRTAPRIRVPTRPFSASLLGLLLIASVSIAAAGSAAAKRSNAAARKTTIRHRTTPATPASSAVTASSSAPATSYAAAPPAPVDPGLDIPPLVGLMACAGYSGCNTSSQTFAADSGGHAVTEWTDSYEDQVKFDKACQSPNGVNPTYIYNPATGALIGVYIDNEADSVPGVYAGRRDLVNCAYDQGVRIILVGLYPNESQAVINDPSGKPVGTMLEWFPYCGTQQLYNPLPPPRPATTALGYIVQYQYNGYSSGCADPAAPTAQENQQLLDYAWWQVDDLRGPPYGDLVANY